MTTELTIQNPFTGTRLGSYPLDSFEIIEEKLRKSRFAQCTWQSLSLDARIAALEEALTYFGPNIHRVVDDWLWEPPN